MEVALQSNKLWPRLEARLRLRYAGILAEETVNTMEAETALTKGIALCDKVFPSPRPPLFTEYLVTDDL
jgi:hypothetical protein